MRNKTVRVLASLGILAALSIVLVAIVHFPIIPAAPYLEYDPADIPILIGGFLFGPLAGIFLTVVASGVQALTVSAQAGWVGFVMHLAATGTLVGVSSLIYCTKKTRARAIVGLLAGSLAMTAVMIGMNLWLTPIFNGMPFDAVVQLIVPVIIPFNLIKSLTNGAVTFLLYKQISKLVKT